MLTQTRKIGVLVYLSLLAILPTIAIWFPFFMRLKEVFGIPIPEGGMQIVAANYDGPLYIVIAKSLYDLDYISKNFSFPLPLEYYAAHFPLYPLIIKFFAFAVGYPWGMLLTSIVGSFLAIFYFYFFIKQFASKQEALWLTAVFAIFPARWLIVRSVGSPEPFFVGAILASIYHFGKKQYLLAALWGVVAQLTKSPGILLFIGYAFVLIVPKISELVTNHDFVKWVKNFEYKSYPILLIPLSLIILFYVYYLKFGDFFAYFNSGDNIHLFFPPFQIFNYSQAWVNTHWLEEVILIYLIGLIGLSKLFKQKHSIPAWFSLVFMSTIFFVSHRDILRYSLPVVPFIILAFRKELVTREFKIIMLILIVPIYLFSLAFISNNAMPISDWGPLL